MTTGNTTLGWEHSNVWVGGKLVANYDDYGPALHFVFEDPLGTKRVLANIAGALYGDSVRHQVFVPLGIAGMQLAKKSGVRRGLLLRAGSRRSSLRFG